MKTFLLFISLLILSVSANAQTLPTGFFTNNVTPGTTWIQPVGAVFSKIGYELFVWEKSGKLYVCNRDADGNYIRQNTPVLDISEEVGDYSDYGMLGFALDPQFESNGNIYVSYVVDRNYLLNYGTPSYNSSNNDKSGATIGRITKFTIDASSGNMIAIPASRLVLLGETKETGVPILHTSHGTGSLAFAADGTLLASMGDGASFIDNDIGSSPDSYYIQGLANGIIRPDENVGAFRSQMLTSLSGKLLRLDADNGNGISSNPFFEPTAPRSTKSRIWALGLRNPLRIFLKPGQGATNPSAGDIGEVFVGDVGFGEWEELNVITGPGMNFGWPLYEGHNPETYVYLDVENKEVPIPPEIYCGGRQFVRFNELIRQDNAAKDASVYYPCSSTLIGSEIHHINTRPILDWKHAKIDQPNNQSARVGTFNAQGGAATAIIGTPASGVTGNVFNGNASTGGIWYTGTGNNFPPEYNNTFLFSDYGEKWIRRVTIENVKTVTRVDEFATNIGRVVCMTENPLDGSVVYVTIEDGQGGLSAVRKISFGGNIPPVAKIKADKYFSGDPTLQVFFDGTESSDQDGSIASYSWNFGDPSSPNNTSASPTPNHIFTTSTGPRKFIVTLTVTDNGIEPESSTREFIVSVDNTPPVVNIISPVDDSKYKLGEDTTYLLKANITDNEQNAGQMIYEWQTFFVHNTHVHPEPPDLNLETSSEIARVGCNGEQYSWLIQLTVTDEAGLSTTASSQIFPDCSGPLPLFLHKFSVTQNGSSNLVKWTTDQESNIEYFELERSENGTNYSAIYREDARNSTGPNHYSFADFNFLPGNNFYRLKIAEHGSVLRYSVVVRTAARDELTALRVVPNPVIGNFSLAYQSAEKDHVTIQIRDITGRLLHTLKEDVNKGQNVIYMQNLPNWNSGVYFISVQNKESIKQTKFIKTR